MIILGILVNMAWYEILAVVIGALGGLSGISAFIISLYNAKSNKETIEVNNADKLVEAAHKLVADLEQRQFRYEERVDQKIAAYDAKFERLKNDNENMRASIYNAYRCTWVDDLKNCPVLNRFKAFCEDCNEDCEKN